MAYVRQASVADTTRGLTSDRTMRCSGGSRRGEERSATAGPVARRVHGARLVPGDAARIDGERVHRRAEAHGRAAADRDRPARRTGALDEVDHDRRCPRERQRHARPPSRRTSGMGAWGHPWRARCAAPPQAARPALPCRGRPYEGLPKSVGREDDFMAAAARRGDRRRLSDIRTISAGVPVRSCTTRRDRWLKSDTVSHDATFTSGLPFLPWRGL